MTATHTTSRPAGNMQFCVFSPFGNKLFECHSLKEAIEICNEKSEIIGGDCYIEDEKENLIYETQISFCEA